MVIPDEMDAIVMDVDVAVARSGARQART